MKKLRITQDLDAPNPRDWDNLGTIAHKSKYDIGEEDISDPIDWLEAMLDKPTGGVYNQERLEDLEHEFYNKYIAEPIYIYEHGGITIRTYPFGCRWDSGKIGYIYVSKKDVRLQYGVKRISKKLRKRVENILNAEIETLDQFLIGDVYRFVLVDEDGEMIDACGGFYGSDPQTNGMSDEIDFNNVEIERV